MSEFVENAKAKLNGLINDITTLEVTTLSGNVEIKPLLADDGKINFQKIIDAFKGETTEESRIGIVATTKIDFDQDVVQFVKENPTEADQKLIELHNSTIKNSLESRKAAMEALISIVKPIG